MIPNARFARKDVHNFFPIIRQRVNEYFEKNNIKRTGNRELHVKTILMFALYFVPYALVLMQLFSIPLMLFCYMVMGLGQAGIGLCVMHDANHGSYSKRKWLNQIMQYSTDLIGASSFTWKIQHNVLHHSFTNVYEMDEDIHDKPFIRLSPSGKLKKYHRFQHIYAPVLYCLSVTSWIIKKDFTQLIDYNSSGMTKHCGYNPTRETIVMIAWKLLYVFYMFALPIYLGVAWWVTLLGFLLSTMVSGFIITIIFQLAHVVEGPDHHAPPEDGKLENTWAIHQLKSTANFACKNRFITYVVGGLNYQIEHHLFPKISHVHYKHISKIVKNTAEEFNLPYYEYKRFRQAVASHIRVLKLLGEGKALKVSS